MRISRGTVHEEAALGKAYDTRLVRRLWRYVRPHRRLLLSSVVLLFAVSAAQLVQPYIIKLAIDGYDPVFGARPLKRLIQQEIANPLARRILAGEFTDGDTIHVDAAGEVFAFTKAWIP